MKVITLYIKLSEKLQSTPFSKNVKKLRNGTDIVHLSSVKRLKMVFNFLKHQQQALQKNK